eukprot:m.7432 g.7432  ORF g.7432 m.7432 type:complete len:121 (-) comp3714_c0_seq1:265-627(-)
MSSSECARKVCDTNEYYSWFRSKDVAGAAAGAATPYVFFSVIGLKSVGPVAGGWFASNMGAAVTAGGAMAGLQSLGMTTMAGAVTPVVIMGGVGYVTAKAFWKDEVKDPKAGAEGGPRKR